MVAQYVSPQEAANRIGLSRSWVYEAIRDGKLPAKKLGKRGSKNAILISEGDLNAFLSCDQSLV